jgi:hypothetical protein
MTTEIVEQLDQEFGKLIESLKDLVQRVPPDLLYKNSPAASIGESILRSAAAIEQTCEGITANLWDDPFEWTLPETLSSSARIIEYLSEVDLSRQRAFKAIFDDSALNKYISVPSGEACRLSNVLIDTLVRASDYRGRAVASSKILFGEGATGFII